MKKYRAQPMKSPLSDQDYFGLYWKAWGRTLKKLSRAGGGPVTAADCPRLIFYGIRAMNRYPSSRVDIGQLRDVFGFFRDILHNVGLLTPNQLMRIFPIDKTYNGAKLECMDYFYTMGILEKHGLNNPIGDNAIVILWNYLNPDTRVFVANYAIVIDAIRRLRKKNRSVDKYFGDLGKPAYTLRADPRTGQRYLRNDKTGKVVPVSMVRTHNLKRIK